MALSWASLCWKFYYTELDKLQNQEDNLLFVEMTVWSNAEEEEPQEWNNSHYISGVINIVRDLLPSSASAQKQTNIESHIEFASYARLNAQANFDENAEEISHLSEFHIPNVFVDFNSCQILNKETQQWIEFKQHISKDEWDNNPTIQQYIKTIETKVSNLTLNHFKDNVEFMFDLKESYNNEIKPAHQQLNPMH